MEFALGTGLKVLCPQQKLIKGAKLTNFLIPGVMFLYWFISLRRVRQCHTNNNTDNVEEPKSSYVHS